MSTPSTILAPVTLASNNNTNKMQETNLHKAPQLQQQHLQQQHHHALASKSAAATNKMMTPLGVSSSSVGNSNDKVVAPFKPAPLSSSPPSYAHAADEQQQQLKATLTADLKLLSHEFERFQQSSDDEAGAAERASKVQFFLDYIDRVVSKYIYINK